jgi:acetoin utilization deacetylase AcuC-like enzyme
MSVLSIVNTCMGNARNRKGMLSMNVVYGEKMVAELYHHISPSSFKPRLLVEHLRNNGYRLQLHEPPAMSRDDLCLAHDPAYVDNVLSCREANGFGNYDPGIAASLPYTSGSLYLAACLALEHGLAASFSSGFHHAGHNHGGGFCTFNGLMVTACRVVNEKKAARVMILDLDYHYGNGTDDIIRSQAIDFVRHESLGSRFHNPTQAGDYLKALERIMDSLEKEPVDLILYQAGADVHVHDPLGGVLTTAQMETRDRMVFETARRLGLPVAWNLAGGYHKDADDTYLPVLILHEQTFRVAQEVYGLANEAPAEV